MSDDYDVLHGEAPLAEGPPKKKPAAQRYKEAFARQKKPLIIGGVVIGVIAVVVATQEKQVPPMAVTGVPELNSVVGGRNQVETPTYRAAVDTTNRAGAEDARQVAAAGGTGSFIPTLNVPEEPLFPAAPVPPPEPSEEPQAAAPQAPAPPPAPSWEDYREELAAQQGPAAQQAKEQRERDIMRYGAAVGKYLGYWEQARGVHEVSARVEFPEETVAQASSAAGGSGPAVLAGLDLIPAGSIMYGRMVTGVNSHNPGPAVAEVVGGVYDGARLSGDVAVDGQLGLPVLQFSSMSWGGRTFPVTAFAVDAASGELGAYDYKDPMIVERYVIPFAADFIAGAAKVAATLATTTTVTDRFSTQSTEKPTLKEVVAGGLEKSADQVAADLKANTPKTALYKLRANADLGIVFTAPVRADQQP